MNYNFFEYWLVPSVLVNLFSVSVAIIGASSAIYFFIKGAYNNKPSIILLDFLLLIVKMMWFVLMVYIGSTNIISIILNH